MAAAVRHLPRVEPPTDSPTPRVLHVRRELLFAQVAIFLTLLTACSVMITLAVLFGERYRTGATRLWLEDGLFLVLLAVFAYGNLVYLIARFGYFKRVLSHRRATRYELERIYDGQAKAVAILIPSYREELRVVEQTLMSAALMEYPNKRIILLIDDPPHPSDATAAADLAATRRLPHEIESMLRVEERRYAVQVASFESRRAHGALDLLREARLLAELYSDVAAWMNAQAANYEVVDHTDKLYVERVLREPAREYWRRSTELKQQASTSDLREDEIAREFRRLASLFSVRITSFERKRFENLSHAPNKAMNLNSYMALIGRNFREVIRPRGLHLEECDVHSAQLKVPDADYIITVDADSLLLNDYALRLIHIMAQPKSRRFAVVQSPYTAVPGSASLLERAAGAQTDVGWIMSQGYRHFGAAFWVGANALLRREALEDICQVTWERGYLIRRYVQDRTLVEDTESTLDLVARGWELYNYPERLSYSATPRDFGSLVIKRRRWSNGGLLILPNLLRYLAGASNKFSRLWEAFFRFHYLAAPTAVNVAMMLLLCIPFKETRIPALSLIVLALPYFALYARDLVQNNYKLLDMLHVYALNLLLIPVNLGGIAHSTRQIWTGRVVAFARTPKIRGRSSAPRLYVLGAIFFPVWAPIIGIVDLFDHKWLFAAYALFNTCFSGYALLRFVGVREAWEDLQAHFKSNGLREKMQPTSEVRKQLAAS